MKTRDNEHKAKVAELERIFQQMSQNERSDFPSEKDHEKCHSSYKSGKPRASSLVCAALAGSFLLCLGWNQYSLDQSLARLSSLPTLIPAYIAPPDFNKTQTYNDPHTIEGTAAIHKEMQSGTVNVSKSTITGIVDSESMTVSLYWTFLLKNNNATDKEAAISMDLPKNSAVSRATLWINGVAQEAAFSSNKQVQNAYDSIVVRHRDPLLVTQTAPNKIKILAAPVTANGGEMQFRIGITAPAEIGADGKVRISLPHITESNLKFDSKQDLHLDSDTRISGIGKTERSGIYTLKANIDASELDKVKIEMKQASERTFATRLTHTNPPEYVKASIENGELELARVQEKPACKIINDDDLAFRLSNLWAHQEIERLAASAKINEACNIANVYRIVSSVSGATVLEEQYDYSNNGLNRDMYRVVGRASSTGEDFSTVQGFVPYSANYSSSDAFSRGPAAAAAPMLVGATQGGQMMAPMLQGATNGTIGPQGADATAIMGVNTAATVRVNNLANLEAIMNLVSYLMQVMGISIAAFLLSESAVNDGLQAPWRLSRWQTLALGLFAGALAMLFPSFVSMMIVGLRDMNFFS